MSRLLLESGDYLLLEDGTSFQLLEELAAIFFGPLVVHRDPPVVAHQDAGVAVHRDPSVVEGVMI